MLLEDTEKTIQTIARDPGFGSIDQFRRLFEKVCSIGPQVSIFTTSENLQHALSLII